MMRSLTTALLGLLLLPSQAIAWGETGHRLVASVAAYRLTPAARREVDRLLDGEAEPSLAGIATWADDLRAHDPSLGKRSARWHYVNLAEDGCHYYAPRDCPGGNCAVDAIRNQAAILADRAQPKDARQRALKFVVHFVGDIHQPLHAGFDKDKGGNTKQVSLPGNGKDRRKRRGTNLHALWDSGLLRMSGKEDAEWLARLRKDAGTHSHARMPLPPPPSSWAEASCKVVLQEGFYPQHRKLPADYLQRWQPTMQQQLALAGVRLASLLNATLDPGARSR